MQPHFLTADDVWTKDLFAAMKVNTTLGHTLGLSRIPETPETAPFKAGYLAAYNAQFGANRGVTHQVTNTTTVDEIDGLNVEDWVFQNRLNPKYGHSFTDLTTNKAQSGAFMNPDPTVVNDPYWNGGAGPGVAPTNLDRDPQGVNNGVTFFLLDTFSPSYADQYFTPTRYHYWRTAAHVTDPDTASPRSSTTPGDGAGVTASRSWISAPSRRPTSGPTG